MKSPALHFPLKTALRYGAAVLAVGVAFAVWLAITDWVGPGLPAFITFYPAVMIVALLAGLGPGLVATVLTEFIAGWWVFGPVGQLRVSSAVEDLAMALFAGMGIFISVIAELYRLNRFKAAAYDKEQALREARREKEFLANLLANAEQPFAVGYADGRLGLFNRAYEDLTGYTAAELRSLDWSTTLTPPEWRELEKQKLEELQRTGKPVRFQKEYVRRDGRRVPIELLVHFVPEADGKSGFYYTFIEDITERRAAEALLRESAEREKVAEAVAAERKRFNDLLNMLPAYVILLSPDYHVPFANRFFEQRFGKSNGKRCYEYLFNRTEPCENCETYKVLKTNAPHHWEWTGPDNRNYDIFDFPFTDHDGSPLIMEMGIDITERKRAEAALKEANEKLEERVSERTAALRELNEQLEQRVAERTAELAKANEKVQAERQRFLDMLDTLPVIIDIIRADHRIEWANRAYREALGDNQGRLCFQSQFGHDHPCNECQAFKPFETGRPHHWEWTLPNGRTFDIHNFPFAAADGSPAILEMDIDITERKQAEAALKGMNETLEKRVAERTAALSEAQEKLRHHNEELEKIVASRTAKLHETIGELEHFSYAIVHDMRAPLRAMQGFATLIEEECGSCERSLPKEYFRRIKIASGRMDQLIADSLNYSKAARQDLPLEAVDLFQLLDGMVKTYPNLQPDQADVQLDPSLPVVLGNEAALTQCFGNLLGNAVKFAKPNSKPRISIRAEAWQTRDTTTGNPAPAGPAFSDLVRIWIEDNGIGISRVAQERIFDLFQRADTQREGTGLGLAIVRKVVERMGGRVGVESDYGQGSRFWVELPLA